MTAKRFRGILEARGIQGVVFVATIQPAFQTEYLEVGKHFACAVAGMRFPELPFHVAIGDFLEAGRISIHRLVRFGFKRPGIVLPRGVDKPMAWAFSGGLMTGMMELQPENRIPILHVGKDRMNIGPEDHDTVKKMLQDHQPDCVLTLDVKGMAAILKELSGEGIDLPLYSLDWQAGGGSQGGINQRHRSIGEAAVDLVMGQIRRGEVGIPEVHRSVHIEGEWVDAKSGVAVTLAS
jgi:LacI family transcriptional regulator